MTRRSMLACLPAGALALLPSSARGDVPAVYRMSPTGHAPGNLGLAVTPDGATAYVTFSLDDALLEVDLASWTVRGAIDVGPAGIMLSSNAACLSADARWLAVANQGAGNVMIVDTAARRIATVLPLAPGHNSCLTITPDGQAFLIAGNDGNLYRVSIPGWSYRALARPAGMPLVRAIAMSPFAPDTVYCIGERPSTKDQALAVYRLSDQTARAILPLPSDLWHAGYGACLRASATSAALFLGTFWMPSDRGSGALTLFDPSQPVLLVTTAIDDGVTDFVLCDDLGKVYTIGFWSGGASPGRLPLTEWDIASRTVTRTFTMEQSSDLRAIARNPLDPNSVLVTEGDRDQLRRFSIGTGERTANLAFTTSQVRPYSFMPAGNRTFVVCPGERSVRVFDWESMAFGPALSLPSGFSGGAHRDGVLYFLHGNRAYALSADTGSVLHTYNLSTEVNTICPSLTAEHLVCVDVQPGGMVGKRLLAFALSDFSLVREVALNAANGCADKVIISPDGSKAYLVGGGMSGPARITIFNAATWDVRRVLDIPSFGGSGFSDAAFDEARRLCYLLGFGVVFRVDMDTDELLAIHNLRDLLPSIGRTGGWSPTGLSGIFLSADSSRLFVVSGDSHSLYTFDCDRRRWLPHILNLHGYFITDAARSPDRRYILTANQLTDSLTLVDTAIGQVVGLYDLHADSQPSLLPFNLVNAASLQSGPVSPGEVVALYGLSIGPQDPWYGQPGADGLLPSDAGGVRVQFDGVPAQLTYAAPKQIYAIVPASVAGSGQVTVWIETPHRVTNAIAVAVAPAAPAIFTADGSGIGPAIVQNEDRSINGAEHAAPRGSVVTLWATGIDAAGAVAAEIDGKSATVASATALAGQARGIVQLALRVPATATAGSRAVSLVAAGARSAQGVTLLLA